MEARTATEPAQVHAAQWVMGRMMARSLQEEATWAQTLFSLGMACGLRYKSGNRLHADPMFAAQPLV